MPEPGSVPMIRYATTTDGVSVAWQSVGSGPALVWMPSLGNLVAQWRIPFLRRAYEALAGSLQLVLYDGRGTGSSSRQVDPDDLGVDAQLRDLDAVLAAAGLEHYAVLGYYHSVPAALAHAAAHPDRVTRMVLFGGSARTRDVMSPSQTQALLSLVEQDWDLFAESAAHAWLGWQAGEAGRLLAESFRTAASPTVVTAMFREAAQTDVHELLPSVRTPTLVVHRQSDRQMPPEVSAALATALPAGRLVQPPGDRPALFLEDLPSDVELVAVRHGRDGARANRRRRPGRPQRPDPEGARGAPPARRRREQRRDRPRPPHHRAHRRAARREPLPQDRGAGPGGGHRIRPPSRSGLTDTRFAGTRQSACRVAGIRRRPGPRMLGG